MMKHIVSVCLLSAIVPQLFAEGIRGPIELRKAALAVIAPLPEKAPGADRDTPQRIALGKKLFHEKKLSVNQSQSCNTCHRVDANLGGVDNEPFSLGAHGKRGGRNAPTVLNAAFHVAQFWDGRADSLEDQAKGPVLNPIEMAMPNETEVVQRLSQDRAYRNLFAAVFPGEAQPISYDNVAKAIAAFERTLITRDRFDDFLKGDDKALTGTEQKGLDLFLTSGCTTCHHGPLLGGNSFQKVGLVNPYPNTKDLGREAVTKDDSDRFKFKVPSLRNIALTAPYFHDSAATSLTQAVQDMAHLQLGKQLDAEETKALVSFLQALSDKPRSKGKFASK